jgi:hypothetical protein
MRSLGRRRSWDTGPFSKLNPGEEQHMATDPSIIIHNHLRGARDERSRIEEGPDGGVVVHNHIPEDGPVLEDDEE